MSTSTRDCKHSSVVGSCTNALRQEVISWYDCRAKKIYVFQVNQPYLENNPDPTVFCCFFSWEEVGALRFYFINSNRNEIASR